MASANQTKPSVQAGLTESSFARYLEGYSQVVPQDLVDAKGGQLRYAVDTMAPGGRVVSTQFRLGGRLIAVDPNMRFIRLLNPYATAPNKTHPGISWSVQLDPGYGKRLRLWYMPPGSKDEIIMFRKLLEQLEKGDIKITKVGS
jgi:hypothetical protein